MKHVQKVIKDNENNYTVFIIPEPKLDGEINMDNLLKKDIDELWIAAIQKGRKKLGTLYVKFRVYG